MKRQLKHILTIRLRFVSFYYFTDKNIKNYHFLHVKSIIQNSYFITNLIGNTLKLMSNTTPKS